MCLVDLANLEPEQVDLACSCSLVSAERGEQCVQLGQPFASSLQLGEVHPGKFIQRIALGVHGEERLVVVLPVHVDQALSEFLELTGSRQSTVHVGTRAPVTWHHPGADHFVVADDETPLHPCLIASRSHHRGLRTGANEQRQRLDDHRLAGARLSRHRRQTGPEGESSVRDDAEVFDVQLDEHYSSPRPNFCRTI